MYTYANMYMFIGRNVLLMVVQCGEGSGVCSSMDVLVSMLPASLSDADDFLCLIPEATFMHSTGSSTTCGVGP